MEATGNYSALLLYMLDVAGITVSMENPLKIKNFARAMLSTVKTDKIDARLIALYGEKMNPQPFKVQGEAILRLRHTSAYQANYRHVEPSWLPRMSACP